MEEKQITTVVEKITNEAKLNSLIIGSKEQLLVHILKLNHINDVFNHVLPVKRSLHDKLSNVDSKEVIIYLGAIDKNNKFTTYSNSKYIVFRVLGKKQVITINSGDISSKQLIQGTELENLSKVYTFSFQDLLATKETFGLYKRKMQYFDVTFDKYIIEEGLVWALNKSQSFLLSVEMQGVKSTHNDGDTVKLHIKDLDFKCKINLKGYNLPRIRTINREDKVTFWHNKEKVVGTVVDYQQLSHNYTDKKGKRIKSKLLIVSFNGHLLRIPKKQVKKVYEND